MVGLQGGTGGTSYGTCGAVIGPSFCVSMVSGIGPKEQLENKYAGSVSCANVINCVTSKFVKDFGSINCRDICFSRWESARYLEFSYSRTKKQVRRLKEIGGKAMVSSQPMNKMSCLGHISS